MCSLRHLLKCGANKGNKGWTILISVDIIERLQRHIIVKNEQTLQFRQYGPSNLNWKAALLFRNKVNSLKTVKREKQDQKWDEDPRLLINLSSL